MTLPLVVHAEAAPAMPTVLWQKTVPSCLQRKEELIIEITEVFRAYHFLGNDEEHWLALCLDEGLMNAMLHGNEADDTVPIHITVGRSALRWLVQIDDYGDGFTVLDVPDQEDSDNLLLEHGRGIRLMREWLDELGYFRNGATLMMGRRIADPTPI
jgi:serine/threonine-protein kinase RsbW